MIEQVLNRRFVLEQLQLVVTEAEKTPDDRRALATERPLTPEDREVILTELKPAHLAELAQSTGQKGYEPPGDQRRGAAIPAPIDDTVFVSHDPVIAIFQSALSEFFEESGKVENVVEDQFGRRGSTPFIPVTDQRIEGWNPHDRTLDGRRVFDPYSVTDPGWVSSLFAMGIRLFRGKVPFNPLPATPVSIQDR